MSNTEKLRRAVEFLATEQMMGNQLSVLLHLLEDLGTTGDLRDKVLRAYRSYNQTLMELVNGHFGVSLPFGDPNSDFLPFYISGQTPREAIESSERDRYLKWTAMISLEDQRPSEESLFYPVSWPDKLVLIHFERRLRHKHKDPQRMVIYSSVKGTLPKVIDFS